MAGAADLARFLMRSRVMMAPRRLETDPAADSCVGDKTDQLSELGEGPDEAETEEMEAPVEWIDPWREH
jgi:hypothetical protein